MRTLAAHIFLGLGLGLAAAIVIGSVKNFHERTDAELAESPFVSVRHISYSLRYAPSFQFRRAAALATSVPAGPEVRPAGADCAPRACVLTGDAQ